MKLNIEELAKEAERLTNPAWSCAEGHDWRVAGGRPCPRSMDVWCSQPAFECRRCGEYDYGEKGGPGAEECEERAHGGTCPLEPNFVEV